MISKLKCKKGSAMQLAIIVLLLVSICVTSISSMVINQTKNNIKTSKNIDLKYSAESGIDEVTAEFIDKIYAHGEKQSFTEFNILNKYVELAAILVGSNGRYDATVSNILKNIENGTVSGTDMKALYDSLDDAIGSTGKSNPHSKEFLGIARDYAWLFYDKFFDQDESLSLSNITYDDASYFIEHILDNLTELEFTRANNVKHYGNINAVYEEIIPSASNYSGNIDNIYNVFVKNNDPKNITNKINTCLKIPGPWPQSTVDEIKKILITNEAYTYINEIDKEIKNIQDGKPAKKNKGNSYISRDKLLNYYKTTGNGNIDIEDTTIQRLEVVKYEIYMLLQWIEYMSDLNKISSSLESESDDTQKLFITVPNKINLLTSMKTISIDYDENNKEENINSGAVTLVSYSDKLEFEILKPSLSTKIVLNLKIQSEADGYVIESDVNVKIYEILSKDQFKIDYEVKNWEKVN